MADEFRENFVVPCSALARLPYIQQPQRDRGNSYHSNGGDGLSANPGYGFNELRYRTNRFNDVTVTQNNVPSDPLVFCVDMIQRLAEWRCSRRTAAWLKLPHNCMHLLPYAIALGFTIHHTQPRMIALYRWLAPTPDKMPEYATHQVGVSVMLIREAYGRPLPEEHTQVLQMARENPSALEILLVRERYTRRKDYWKLITGQVEVGEFVIDAAMRETYEEVGLNSRFLCTLGFWNRKVSRFGRNEIYVLVVLVCNDPLNHPLRLQEDEIQDAKWFRFNDFEKHVKESSFNDIERVWLTCFQRAQNGLVLEVNNDSNHQEMHFHVASPEAIALENSDEEVPDFVEQYAEEGEDINLFPSSIDDFEEFDSTEAIVLIQDQVQSIDE